MHRTHDLELVSIGSPPAACIAALDPVAVLTQRPLDHTLIEDTYYPINEANTVSKLSYKNISVMAIK